MTKSELRTLVLAAYAAKNRVKEAEAIYEDLRDELIKEMEVSGISELTYTRAAVSLIPAQVRVSVDTAKVKSAFPDWESRFLKISPVKPQLRWK